MRDSNCGKKSEGIIKNSTCLFISDSKFYKILYLLFVSAEFFSMRLRSGQSNFVL